MPSRFPNRTTPPPRPPKVYYSQHGEDRWIAENLPLPARGYFVEVGAADGLVGSNTAYFERTRRWHGLLIEPDPRNRDNVLHNRPNCAVDRRAAGRESGSLEFRLDPEPTWSGLARPPREGTQTVMVEVQTLTQILLAHDAPAVIDLLSIDTEGTELDVWAGLNREMFRPAVVVVEFDTAGVRNDPEGVAAPFLAEGYRLAHSTAGNHVLVRGA